MQASSTSNHSDAYDAIVVGAGICGVIFLKYALDHGLRCLVLEKQDEVGGLWNRLPAWQDIQNRTQDYTINDVPLHGAKQPEIVEYVRAWVRNYDLGAHIRVGTEVESVAWRHGEWRVRTERGSYRSRYLIAATGVQNEPWIPDVERANVAVEETHSARLYRPEDLANQRVTVVGGGTSSWDLLERALEHGATDIRWVYRNVRWFLPTPATKQESVPNLRELAVLQTSLNTNGVNAVLRYLLRKLYGAMGVTAIAPSGGFDIREHQLIPGRSTMTRNLDRITRHESEVRRIRGRRVTLANGEGFDTDTVLWGTGYRMDLSWLDLPEYRDIDTLDTLLPKLGSLVRAIDYPRLFFVGMSLTRSTSSTPFLAAIEAKSIVAHMLGRCEIPLRPTPHQVNYWRLFEHFAEFDHATYPPLRWRVKSTLRSWRYLIFRNRSVRI